MSATKHKSVPTFALLLDQLAIASSHAGLGHQSEFKYADYEMQDGSCYRLGIHSQEKHCLLWLSRNDQRGSEDQFSIVRSRESDAIQAAAALSLECKFFSRPLAYSPNALAADPVGDLAQLTADLAALADRADKLHFSPTGFGALATVAFRESASSTSSHPSHSSHRKPKGAKP